jgi:hypothetical protein
LEDLEGDAAEIGVAEGNFSAEILSWPINLPRVYMVDRWACFPGQKGDGGFPQSWHDKNLAAAQERVAQYNERAVFLRGNSTEVSLRVPDKSLRLVYIDADHSYSAVIWDIAIWRAKLVPGGVMAFHDYESPQYGVKRAVKEYCRMNQLVIHPIPENKPQDAGAYFLC